MVPISDKLSGMLNAQVGREIGNAHLYRQMASWAHVRGLKNIASFFMGEADGEMGHAKLISDFLSEGNAQIIIPAIEAKPSEFSGCEEIGRLYVEAEAATTEFLEEIAHQSDTEYCISVQDLMQRMLAEQNEEEGISDRTQRLIEAAGGNLILLDLAFAK